MIVQIIDFDGRVLRKVNAYISSVVTDTVVLEHSHADDFVFYREYISKKEYSLRYFVPVSQLKVE